MRDFFRKKPGDFFDFEILKNHLEKTSKNGLNSGLKGTEKTIAEIRPCTYLLFRWCSKPFFR